MKNFNQYVSTLLISLAFANLLMSIPCSAQVTDPTPKDLSAERIQVLMAQDPGILTEDQADGLARAIMSQAAAAQVAVRSASRVTSQSNTLVCEKRQSLALEATGPQLLHFLRSLAESNSVLRVRDLSMRPNPERTRFAANVVVVGHYRLQSSGEAQRPELLETDYEVLNGRRHLRYAALDCYLLATEGLPAGWTLESLVFEGGKRLSLKGNAPADQVSSLEDVRTKFQAAKGHGGEDLFRPSTSQATMRIIETNFFWEIELELRQGALR